MFKGQFVVFFLCKFAGLTKEGNLVDSRVEAFAIGLQMGLKFAKDAAKDAISTLQASLPLDGSSVRTGFGKQLNL